VLDPDRPGIRQNYGKLLRELGRDAESERELRIALAQTTDDDARTRINLAQTLVSLKKTGEADTLLTAVLSREPKNAEALGAKGRLLLTEGRTSEGVAALEQAATTSDPELLIEVASAYLDARRLDKAAAAATEALRRAPGHPWALALLGHALILEGRAPEGAALLERAAAIHPRRPAVWDALAEGFDAAGQNVAAAQCRREARALVGSKSTK
jgi:predicted Zn-dependent protease